MEENSPVFLLGDLFPGTWEFIYFFTWHTIFAFVRSAKPLNVNHLNNRKILLMFIKFLSFFYNTSL